MSSRAPVTSTASSASVVSSRTAPGARHHVGMVEPVVPARVALFHGWAGSPVWYRTPDKMGPVDLAELPISDGLRQRLLAWDLHADTTLSAHDLEWPDTDTEARFTAAGSVLAQELRDELGIEVVYTPDGDEDTPPPRPDPLPGHFWTAFAPLSGETYDPRPPSGSSTGE